MEERNERDEDPGELDRKQQRDIRAFIDFLVRHPERRKQFIREVVNAGAPREAVERVMGDEDLFVPVVLGDMEKNAGDVMDLTATAGAVERLEESGGGNEDVVEENEVNLRVCEQGQGLRQPATVENPGGLGDAELRSHLRQATNQTAKPAK